VIVGAALNALQLRWISIVPYAARGLGLAALCAGAVIAGQQAVSAFTFPGVSLYAGGLAAAAAMALVLFVRPQTLGFEAQSALARLVPRFGPRLAPAVAVSAEPTGDAL
jgi:lipopolysaccharide exporter